MPHYIESMHFPYYDLHYLTAHHALAVGGVAVGDGRAVVGTDTVDMEEDERA